MMVWAQIPSELVARSLYNAKVLWRRPLSGQFGDMGSLMVATPEQFFLKDGTGVLVLNPETGDQISRIEATKEPLNVSWLAVSDGVLLTLAGPKPFNPMDIPRLDQNAKNKLADEGFERASQGQEMVAWDARSGKELWRFNQGLIAMRQIAVSAGRVFLHVNSSDAVALDLHSGKQLWKSPAPVAPTTSSLSLDAAVIMNGNRGEPQAISTSDAYVICDLMHLQYQAFAAKDGHLLWNKPHDPKNPPGLPRYPFILGDVLLGGKLCNVLTGEPVKVEMSNSQRSASCGHFTALEVGGGDDMFVGFGVGDMKTGKQIAPYVQGAPCGTGFFVADGTEVLFPNTCACTRGWHGLMTISPASSRLPKAGSRLEKGDAPPAAGAKADASDWPSYRSDETRKGSSAATIPANGVIRWTYAPPRPAKGTGVAGLPAYFERNMYATQSITVGDGVWFGTAEGSVVCLDRKTGARQWESWTAGPILSTPTWSQGRVYAGSADGWLYCFDGATGKLCWRYRVAPEDRRINVMGRLSSAWAVQSILVHDGVAYATAGVLGRLDGSAMCAVDAQTGTERWSKVFKNKGETLSNGRLKDDAPTGGEGSMAWYGGKVWWLTSDFGPLVINPATGEWKRALDTSFLGDPAKPNAAFNAGSWANASGKDIGILPGGWVALGNKMMFGACDSTTHVFFQSGPDGIPAGAEHPPLLLTPNRIGQSFHGSFYAAREIPVWDASEVLTYDNSATAFGPPTLYRNFSEALNQAGKTSPPRGIKGPVAGADDLAKTAFLNVPAEQKHAVLPDAMWEEIAKQRAKTLYGTMLLAGNAVVLTRHGDSANITDLRNGRMPNYGDWRVVAISRTDHSTLFDINLPDAPAPSGMSLTRAGDVIVPLVDGRVVCIGATTAPKPLPAAGAPETVPGLQWEHRLTDVPLSQYYSWSEEDVSILKSDGSKTVATANFKEEKSDAPSLVWLRGFVEVPETGKYRFYAQGIGGSLVRFKLQDQSGYFAESAFDAGGRGAQSNELLLAKGKHPVSVIVMPGSSGNGLTLQWEGPGIKRCDIPAAALSHN